MTLWTVACQAPLPMGFSRQEYWGGSPCPPPGDLPDPEIKPTAFMSVAVGIYIYIYIYIYIGFPGGASGKEPTC